MPLLTGSLSRGIQRVSPSRSNVAGSAGNHECCRGLARESERGIKGESVPTSARTHKAKTQRKPDCRPSPSARGYGSNWQKIRAAHLAANPLCEDCKNVGRVAAAKEVDHIDGDSSNNDSENHRSLCKSCHSRKTCRENGGLRGKMQ